VGWAPRSPDLNPLDFALKGYLKEKVYSVKIQNQSTPSAEANYRRLRSCGSGYASTDTKKYGIPFADVSGSWRWLY
jgi:hypothetical protein